MHERVLGKALEVARQGREQHLRLVLGLETRAASKHGGGLAERLEVDHAVAIEREARESFHLVSVEQTCSHPLELVDDVVVDVVVDDTHLLRGTDHRRVKGLRDENVDHGHADVRRPVQVDGRITRSDADRGLAGRIRRLHDLGAAGRPDEVDRGVLEQVLRDLAGRVGDHLQRAARQAGPLARLAQDLHNTLGAAHRAWRRAKHDGVAGLRRHDGLEQHRRGWVRDGSDGHHDADGLGHVLEVALGIDIDHPDRPLVLQVVVEELRRDVVLHDLVLEHTEAGLLDGQLGQLGRGLEPCNHHRPDHGVDGFLVELPELAGRLLRSLDDLVELGGSLSCHTPRVRRLGCVHAVPLPALAAWRTMLRASNVTRGPWIDK